MMSKPTEAQSYEAQMQYESQHPDRMEAEPDRGGDDERGCIEVEKQTHQGDEASHQHAGEGL